MQHAAELLAILTFMAVGQCVVSPSAHLLRRVLCSLGWSVLAFGGAILVISMPSIAVTAVQLAGMLIAIYMLRWIIGGIVEHFHGPLLMNMPGVSDVAAAAAQATGASCDEAKRAARRILRRNEGYVSLAGLLSLGTQDAQNLENAWQVACDKTRDELIEIARPFVAGDNPGRVPTAAIQFLAQTRCFYEPESLNRALAHLKAVRLDTRHGREQALKLIDKQAKRNDRAEQLGIAPPTGEMSMLASALRMEMYLWPAIGFQRLGFTKHAIVLSVTQALLVLYGISAIIAAHGLRGNSGYVFLAVALVVHIQALLSMGDFADAAQWERMESAEGRNEG